MPPFDTLSLTEGIQRLLETPIVLDKVQAGVIAKFSAQATLPRYLSVCRTAGTGDLGCSDHVWATWLISPLQLS